MPRQYVHRLEPGEVAVGKRYIDTGTRCPFYRSEDAQKVYCDGPEDGCYVHLAFGNKAEKKAWKKRFCRKEWKLCRIAAMQEDE